MATIIEPHNQAAATVWSAGGPAYDQMSFQISDALSHAVQRLWPEAGERVLDVATGTGWTARNVARAGAQVTGIDIAEDLLAAARTLSAHVRPPIDFKHGDAERLPFPDASFDRVISTFGVMFAGNHRQAAAELARVCKPGGRLVLGTWIPEGTIGQMFALIGKYNPAPPPPQSPLEWGREDHVRALLGDAFELGFERGSSVSYYPDGAAILETLRRGFGPFITLSKKLDEPTRKRFEAEIVAFHDHFKTSYGLRFPRDYLLTIGTRH